MMNYFSLLLLGASEAFAATPIHVPIHFFEALAPRDTTSSERFQKEYESAIRTAKTLSAKRLAQCGYQLDEQIVFYEAGDPLQAHERGKASAQSQAWLLVGPRRSNHYVLLAKGAPETPSVSTMASSQEVEELGPLHRSLSPSNKQMAATIAREAKALIRGVQNPSYVTVVSKDCLACVDFATHFDNAALKLKLKKLSEHPIQSEVPELGQIAEAIAKRQPSIVLVPNLSKVTAQVIAAIHKVYPKAVFVGGDGWGDSRFGFVQNAKDLEGTRGITVRGFPTTEAGLNAFRLGRDLLASENAETTKPGSASALAILKVLDGTVDLLCTKRPKTARDFKAAFVDTKNQKFSSPWGVSIYQLRDGDISFQKTVEGTRR